MMLSRSRFVAVFFLALVNALPGAWQVGDKIEIKWGSHWYPGEVLDVKGEQYKVRYDGYSTAWDEWTSTEKLRDKNEVAAVPVPPASGALATAAAATGPWKKGDRVEAKSYGSWYPATVLEAGDGKWKVTYDGYPSSSDEWLPAASIRLPSAPVSPPAGQSVPDTKAVPTNVFPLRPTGAKAGIEGAYLRLQTYYFGSSLSITNQGWFFTKGGRFSREPLGGVDLAALAAKKAAAKTEGSYWIEGNQITFAYADGSAPTKTEFVREGKNLRWTGLGSVQGKPFKSGWRLDGTYEGGASIGGASSSATIVFHPDGTFSYSSVASISSSGDRSTVTASSQGGNAGTYTFEPYTLTLTLTNGTATKHTVFAYGDVDGAGLPERIYNDGTMMKRQDRKK